MAKEKPSLQTQGKTLRRVLRYIRPHRPRLILSLVLALVSVALTLYVPILIGRAIDCIVGAGAVNLTRFFPSSPSSPCALRSLRQPSGCKT